MSAAQADVENVAPPLVCRWLHGGPPLQDLTSIPLSATTGKDAPPSVWRSFTDGENERLEAAWQGLDQDTRERAWRAKVHSSEVKSGKSSAASSRRSSVVAQERPAEKDSGADAFASPSVDKADEESLAEASRHYIADPEDESKPHIVHVSQDNLFSADVLSLSLYPVFWKGSRIGIQRATWFYPSTSTKKYYPIDPLLSQHLEEAYHEIRPFDASYADELRSALEFGADAEAKLKHSLPEVGVDVIFQTPESARVYARNLPARLSKSFLTSFIRDKGHSSGGTLVYRGYDAVLKHLGPSSKSAKAKSKATDKAQTLKGKTSTANLKGESSAATSDSDTEARHSDPTQLKPKEAAKSAGPSRLANLFSLGYSTSTDKNKGQEPVEQADDNTTAEAMEDSKGHDDGKQEPELAELVLVVHGIGQKLATTYDSFNIVHAINQLRKICNTQCKDPAVSQVVGNKRLQFIPLQWRSSLQFEQMLGDEENAEAQLDNAFALDDIQVQGAIPFVRSMVTGVALDLAFYMSHHRDKMTAAVVRDANRIYRLFRQRNPGFRGKVSLIAHSLGTALCTDILSNQPTRVADLDSISSEQQASTKNFIFDVSTAFYLGSPVGYMFFLNRAQLIARKGRARTKNAPKEVALDETGRYGCMAIDSLYNVYNVVDPVAVCLNAVVDAELAKVVKPLPISTVTSSLLSDYSAKVSSFLGSWMPSFGGSGGSSTKAEAVKEKIHEAELHHPDTANGLESTGESGDSAAQVVQRPKTKRQMTSELRGEGLRRFERAEARMLALNPQGSIDFYLTAEGYSQYYDMLISHASYWTDTRFATFLLTQLLASSEELEKAKEKREEQEEQAAAQPHPEEGRGTQAEAGQREKAAPAGKTASSEPA